MERTIQSSMNQTLRGRAIIPAIIIIGL